MMLFVPSPTPSPSTGSATEHAAANVNTALLGAIVGIAGALIVAVITQWVTWALAKRKTKHDTEMDEKRWTREQDRERQRWERERQERQDQWQREDDARLYQVRVEHYSALLLAAEKVHQSLMYLHALFLHPVSLRAPNSLKGSAQVAAHLKTVTSGLDDLWKAWAAMVLIGSTSTRNAGGHYGMTAAYAQEIILTQAGSGDPCPDLDEFLKRMRQAFASYKTLWRAMRAEVGIDSTEALDFAVPGGGLDQEAWDVIHQTAESLEESVQPEVPNRSLDRSN